jgi:SAM-dependent methyltransferase
MSASTPLESDYYRFMGYDSEASRRALTEYVAYFEGAAPVVELGSGRGEFLGLLGERGISAYGVDSDEGMVQSARAAGCRVVLGDARAHLQDSVEAGSVGGVFAAHFLEHLDPADVERVTAGVRRALRPGGVFVTALPNPACLAVLCYDFWKDPTHVRPYDPQLIAFFCARAGLAVEHIGGNPRNTGGPLPGLSSEHTTVDPGLGDSVAAAIQRATSVRRRRPTDQSSPWYDFGHLVSTLDERLRRTQHELASLRQAYENLLGSLFQANEVYVVARG